MICAHCLLPNPQRVRGFSFYGKGAVVCKDLDDGYLQTSACAARWREMKEMEKALSSLDEGSKSYTDHVLGYTCCGAYLVPGAVCPKCNTPTK